MSVALSHLGTRHRRFATMTPVRVVVFALCGLGGAVSLLGCPTAPPELPNRPLDSPTPDVTVAPEPAPGVVPELASCALEKEPRWVREFQDFYIAPLGKTVRGPRGMTKTNGAFGSLFLRAEDGAGGALDNWNRSSLSRAWDREVRTDTEGRTVSVHELPSDAELFSLDVPGSITAEWVSVRSVALASTGARGAALWCWSENRDGVYVQGAVLQGFNVDTATVDFEVVLDDCVDEPYRDPTVMALSKDGRMGAIASGNTGDVIVFDVDSQTTRHHAVIDIDTIDEQEMWVPSRFLDLKLSSDGAFLAVTTVWGAVHLLDTARDEVLWSAPAAAIPVRQFTYVPGVASPVAFSADGSLLAFVRPVPEAPQGEDAEDAEDVFATLELVQTTTGANAGTLTMPIPVWEEHSTGTARGAPTSVIFDEVGLTVALENGAVHYECSNHIELPPVGDLAIAIEAPATVSRTAARLQIQVRTPGFAGAALRGIIREDGARQNMGLAEALDVYVPSSETDDEARLTIFVDDGVRFTTEDIHVRLVD